MSLFFLAGPTAVGKSEIAVQVAEACGAEIVGADAFQIYAGMEILTAQPSAKLRARVRHHLIGEIPPARSFDAAQFRELALARIAEIEQRGKRVIVVGGTGLYIRALTHGLAGMPAADAALRAELEQLPLAELQRRYAELDPRGWEKIDRKNPRRLIRAIEVSTLTGAPFSSLRDDWSEPAPTNPAEIRGALLLRERDELNARIDSRVSRMFEEGVIEEVRRARDTAGPTARQALGFAEISAHLEGTMGRETCIALICQRTRQYARRQLTWFRKQGTFLSISLTHRTDNDVASGLADRILSGSPPA